MRNILILLILTVFLACSSDKPKNDVDANDNGLAVTDVDTFAPDNSSDLSDGASTDVDGKPEEIPDVDDESETPDVDMYCPLPMDAKYPYFREDGTIHFCRPCDTPDEYDPQCVKSLWKDLNKEVYDKYKNGEFEDNEHVVECYPWPCEWDVKPMPPELMPGYVHKCDIFLNPRTWANSFSGFRKEADMNGGKIIFRTDNYRIGDKKPIDTFPGYAGQRSAIYDIKTGKYEIVAGNPGIAAYMNGTGIISAYSLAKKTNSTYDVPEWIVSMVPYKGSYKYNIIYHNENNHAALDVFPYMTDKWTIMVINNFDKGENTARDGNRSLVYSKTGEWQWTTLAYGNPEGKAGELSIAGDKAMFAHIGTNTSYICDLSKSPKSLSDCKRISREGESAGFPKFDKDNPNRIIYRSIVDGGPANKMAIVDISKEPWKIEKEFEIPSTEVAFLSIWLIGFKSNVILYEENFVMNESGYQEDGKLCYYRIDKGKTYCSKPIENQTSYGHGYAAFEGKYLFWQPMYKAGYILRDMECYCKEEGICPFEE
ncbi:MAG: hypothetical protein ACOX2F_01180 [bacterium]